MSEMSTYKPGTFSWVDLATSDAAAAKEFYTALFGWTVNDLPMGPDAFYSMLRIDGKEVAALYALNEQQRSQGVPPHWMSYITVSSVDETASKAESLKGKVVMGPADVFSSGRMALLQDPTGAMVAVWEAREHMGARLVNEPGALCWTELMTNDIDAAGRFYTELFGWSIQVHDMGSSEYTTFMNGEKLAGGMLQMKEEWGNVPPNWMVYFTVENCDGSLENAKELGAEVIAPPIDIPGTGRFAVLQDPQGAAFAIIQLAEMP